MQSPVIPTLPRITPGLERSVGVFARSRTENASRHSKKEEQNNTTKRIEAEQIPSDADKKEETATSKTPEIKVNGSGKNAEESKKNKTEAKDEDTSG